MPDSNSSSNAGFNFTVSGGGSLPRLPQLLAEEYTTALERIGDSGVQKLRNYLKKERINATEQTSESIERGEVQQPSAGVFSMEVGAQGSRRKILGFIEFGRKAGLAPPPVRAIMQWLDDKGISSGLRRKERRTLAFFIARKIGADGVQGKFVVRRTRAYLDQLSREEIAAATQRALQRAVQEATATG